MTQVLLPPPDRFELATEVDGLFEHNDKKYIARYVQRDTTLVSKWLSPNCEDKNHVVYFFILFLWAFDCIRRELGDRVVAIVLREREKWLADDIMIEANAAAQTKVIGREVFEAIETELEGRPIDDQIREWTDARNEITVKLNALIAKRAVDRYRGNFAGNGKI